MSCIFGGFVCKKTVVVQRRNVKISNGKKLGVTNTTSGSAALSTRRAASSTLELTIPIGGGGVTNTQRLLEDIPNKIVTTLGIVAEINLLFKDGRDYIEIVVSPSNIPIAYRGIYITVPAAPNRN